MLLGEEFKKMDTILVKSTSTQLTTDTIFDLFDSGFIATFAIVKDCLRRKQRSKDDKNDYPLTLVGHFNNCPMVVKVFCVSAGFDCVESHTLIEILKYAGFEFEETDILTDSCVDSSGNVLLNYCK